MHYSHGCAFCTGRYKTTDDIRGEVINPNVEIISDYIGINKPITCRCKICGNVWTTSTSCLTKMGCGCPICGKAKAIAGETKKHDEFVAQLHTVNPDILVLGSYVNTHTKILCKCLLDGHEWMGVPANLLNRTAGCPMCSMSLGEKTMLLTLDELGIEYVTQHKIDGCVYRRRLKFDAFNIENNVAFEYNGEQHYYPAYPAGRNDPEKMRIYTQTSLRDKIKIDYCRDHNISMIIVPYWERKNMKQYIIEQLKERKLDNLLT